MKRQLRLLGRSPIEAAAKGGLERNYIRDLVEGKKESIGMDKIDQVAKGLDWTRAELQGEERAPEQPRVAATESGIQDAAVAERLVRLRELLGYETPHGFANYIGVDVTELLVVENDLQLGWRLADIIVRKVPGVTLDWLYYGNASGLPLALARALEPAGNATTQSASAASDGRRPTGARRKLSTSSRA
jgi:hypothetical protein